MLNAYDKVDISLLIYKIYSFVALHFHNSFLMFSLLVCIVTCSAIFLPVMIPLMRSAAFSAIMMTGALMFPDTVFGIMDASATYNPATFFTLYQDMK